MGIKHYSDAVNLGGIQMSKEATILIAGSPRSGTSWLHFLLASHPDIVTCRETHVYDKYVGPLKSWYDKEIEFESNDGSVRASNVVFLDLPKNLKLPKNPEIEVDIQPIVSGYKVKVRSEKLVKNLRLEIPGIDGQWSDNYFDLLPGKSQEVYFSIPQYTPGLEDSLELFHMEMTER